MHSAFRFLTICLAMWLVTPSLFAQLQTCTCSGFNSSRVDSGWSLPDGTVFARARANLMDPAFFGASGVVNNRNIAIGAGVGAVTESSVAGVNVFFTGYTLASSYSAAEKTVIMNAVNNGMNLVLTVDDSLHDISDLFGVTFSTAPPGVDTELNTPTLPDHSIFSGPFGRINRFRGADKAGRFRAWPSGAVLLASSDAGPSMLLIPRNTLVQGSGAVLIIADIDVFTTFMRDTSTNTSDPSVPVTDALLMNIFNFLCVSTATSVAPHIVLPQIADGEGNASSLVLTNTGRTPLQNITVSFRDDNGAPLSVSFIGQGAASTFNIGNMEQNQTNTYTTPAVGTLRSGTALVRGSPLLAANVLFLVPNVGVTGVGVSEMAGGFDLPVVPQPAPGGSRDVFTGLALSNMTGKQANIRLELWDSVGRRSDGIQFITLPPYGHLAKFLFQLYPNFDFVGFKGTLRVVGINALLAATALQLGGQSGQFSALPVKGLY